MVKVLVEFNAWSVCETDDDENSGVIGCEVYAEHYRDCEEDPSPDQASWSWEFDDATVNGIDVCWRCGTIVPEEVVALVQLHNWGRARR